MLLHQAVDAKQHILSNWKPSSVSFSRNPSLLNKALTVSVNLIFQLIQLKTLIFTETWLSDKVPERAVQLQTHSVHWGDRTAGCSKTKRGGVCVCVYQQLVVLRYKDCSWAPLTRCGAFTVEMPSTPSLLCFWHLFTSSPLELSPRQGSGNSMSFRDRSPWCCFYYCWWRTDCVS